MARRLYFAGVQFFELLHITQYLIHLLGEHTDLFLRNAQPGKISDMHDFIFR